MNKLMLKLVVLLRPLWEKLGANMPQLLAILRVKLLMDDRRPNAYTQMRGHKQKKESKNASGIVMFISFLMGCFYLFFFQIGKDPLLHLFIYCCAFMTMLMLTLISDFTYVLIDVKDNLIILPKPVNDRTVLLSRLLHIFIHVSKIIVPMAVPGIILVGYLYGVVGALMLILMILFASVFTIFMINALYLIALRITTPERFKEIINYLQIAFSVMVFAMYYLVPKLVNMATLKDIHLLDYTYLYILPPFWFAGGWVSVVLGRWDMVYIAMLACALVLPMLCLWLVVTRLAPSFNRRLALVSGSGGDTPAVVAQRSQRKFYRNIGKWLSRGRLEQTAFEAVWLMTGRSREFKLKVYPSLAYVFIWFAYMLFSGSQGTPEQAWRNLPDSQLHIILLYISCFAFITAIAQLGYSSKFKAGWVYYAAPLQSPGQILAGALKALMVKFFLPYYLLITAFVLWIWGIKAVPDLLLGLLNVIVLCVVFAFIFLRKLPFSMEQNVQQSGGRILLSIVGILVPMAFGAAHFLVRNSLPLKGIFVVLSAALLWLIFTRYREVSWEELKKA